MQQAQRTQIYLPSDLKRDVNYLRRISGESMAGYIRKATLERVEKDKQEKQALKKLASELGNLVTKSGWEGIDVIKWQREIRKDRKIL